MPIYKTKNEDFFKKWSPEMAYVLGFFAADGNMIKNKRGAHFIEFQSTDKEILNKIKKCLKSNLAIGEYQPKNKNHSKRYRLQIGSKEIFNDLSRLEMTPNKSLTLKLPKIPDKYFNHFTRGYFDGDGNVTISTYKRANRNNRKSITILSGFTSGSEKILEKLHVKLKKLAKILGGTKYYNIWHRLYFSVNDSLRLYKFLYKNLNENLYLSRKKKIFEKYFKI